MPSHFTNERQVIGEADVRRLEELAAEKAAAKSPAPTGKARASGAAGSATPSPPAAPEPSDDSTDEPKEKTS